MRTHLPHFAISGTIPFFLAVGLHAQQATPPPEQAPQLLATLDRDGDETISWDEAMGGLKDNFEIVDRNGDGKIDVAELTRVLRFAATSQGSGDDGGTEVSTGTDSGTRVFDRVEHHMTESDGVALHYVTLGEGPVVLFVHGFPDFWYTWREQMATLSGEYKTVAMDTRANNKSGKPDGVEHYAMQHLLADVEAVIEDLGVDSVTLVGHDWGGAIAWQFAMRFPHRVDKLVICNLTHPRGYATVRRNATPEQKANTQYIADFQVPGYEDRLTPEILTRISAGNVSAVVRERYLTAFERSSTKGMLDYYRAAFGAIDQPVVETPQMPDLTMPVLQFHGLKDKTVDKDGLRDTWNWIDADYTLVTVPGSDHWVQRDAAEIVNSTMLWWLRSRP